MSLFINNHNWNQSNNTNVTAQNRIVQKATHSNNSLNNTSPGLLDKLKQLNIEEQQIKAQMTNQPQQQKIEKIQLQKIYTQKQELLKLLNKEANSKKELKSTQSIPDYTIGRANSNSVQTRVAYNEISDRVPLRKSINWVNTGGFNSNSYATEVITGNYTETRGTRPNGSSTSLKYVTPINQTQDVTNTNLNYLSSNNNHKQQLGNANNPSKTEIVRTHNNIKIGKESQQLSEYLALINDPELSLNNYETFIDNQGNKHIRYVVKVGATDTNRSHIKETVTVQPRVEQLATLSKAPGFQQKPIEHVTYDKNGNPVKVYTTIDEKGQPLQIINITQDGKEIQYVSFMNTKGRQKVKMLSHFLEENLSEDAKKAEQINKTINCETNPDANYEDQPLIYVSSPENQPNNIDRQNSGNDQNQQNAMNVDSESRIIESKENNPTLPTKKQIAQLLKTSLKCGQEQEKGNLDGLPSERDILNIIRNKTADAIVKNHNKAEKKEATDGIDDKTLLVKKLNFNVDKVQKYLHKLEKIDPELAQTIKTKPDTINKQIVNNEHEHKMHKALENTPTIKRIEEKQFNIANNEKTINKIEHRSYQPTTNYSSITQISHHENKQQYENSNKGSKSEFKTAAELLDYSKIFNQKVSSTIGVGGIRVTRKSQKFKNRIGNDLPKGSFGELDNGTNRITASTTKQIINPERIIKENVARTLKGTSEYPNSDLNTNQGRITKVHHAEPMVYAPDGRLVPLRNQKYQVKTNVL